MTDDEIIALHNKAHGEALFASTLAALVFMRLENVAPTGREREQLDFALLQLEKQEAARPDDRGAIEYARARVLGLLSFYSKLPRKP